MKTWGCLARRHKGTEVKPESANERGSIRIHSLTICIIFITFMFFMVKMYLFFVSFCVFCG